jgi:hypothetical protein
MSTPEQSTSEKMAAGVKYFLRAAIFFTVGFAVAQLDAVKEARKEIHYGVTQAEWSSYAHDPLDKQITVWNKTPGSLLGGAVLVGSEFSKTVGLLLIDESGAILHRWDMDNRVYNPETVKFWKTVTTQEGLLIDDAHLLPGGDVVFIQSLMDVNNLRGQRLARADIKGHIVWEVPGSFHHYIHIAGNPERIYTMSSRVRKNFPEAGPEFAPVNYLEDWLEVYTLDGKKTDAWSIVDAFANSPYRNWLTSFEIDLPEVQRIPTADGRTLYDLLHLNCVQYLDAAKARSLPLAREGDLLLSFRAISTIAVFRPSSGQIVWATKGPWRHQHTVQVRDDGKLYMFDNEGKQTIVYFARPFPPVEQEQARLIRFDPATNRLDELYASHLLSSVYMGNYQLLASGSWILSGPQQGRVLVVTPDQKITWELRTVPNRQQEPIPHQKQISLMHYYTALQLKSFNVGNGVTHVQ